MPHFDPIKKKLRQETEVPEFLSWDAMETGIVQKVEAAKSRRRRSIILKCLVGLVVVLILSMFTCYHTKWAYSDVAVESGAGDEASNFRGLVSEEEGKAFSSANVAELRTTETTSDLSTKTKVNGNEERNKEGIRDVYDTSKAITVNSKAITSSWVAEPEIGNKRVNTSNQTEKNSTIKKRKLHIVSKEVFIIPVTELESFRRSFTMNIKEAKLEKEYPFLLIFSGGLNTHGKQLGESAIQVARMENEKEILGQSYSLQLDYKFRPKFSVRSGINYDVAISRFNKSIVKKEQEVQEDVVIGYLVNPIGQQRSPIIGDTTVAVTTTRNIRHYNVSKAISVPLSMHYYVKSGRWDASLGAGTQVGIFTRAKGRTSLGDELLEYGPEAPIVKDFSLSFMGSLGINYGISDRIFLGATLTYIKTLNNISVEDRVESRPWMGRAQFSAGYKF